MAFLGGVKTLNRSEARVMRHDYLRKYGKKRVDCPGSYRTTTPPTAKSHRCRVAAFTRHSLVAPSPPVREEACLEDL